MGYTVRTRAKICTFPRSKLSMFGHRKAKVFVTYCIVTQLIAIDIMKLNENVNLYSAQLEKISRTLAAK